MRQVIGVRNRTCAPLYLASTLYCTVTSIPQALLAQGDFHAALLHCALELTAFATAEVRDCMHHDQARLLYTLTACRDSLASG